MKRWIVALFVIGVASELFGTARARAETRQVFMSAAGDDDHYGLAVADSVWSLARAVEVAIGQFAASDAVDTVHIRVDSGGGTFFVGDPLDDASFKAVKIEHAMFADAGIDDLEYKRLIISPLLDSSDPFARPVFDGEGTHCQPFLIVNAEGATTGFPSVEVRGLVLQNMHQGVRIEGGIHHFGAFGLYGNVFHQIGDAYTSCTGPTYAAVSLSQSNWNYVVANRFTNIESFDAAYGLHGVYVNNDSDYNTVAGNLFSTYSGSAVKFKDRCDNNQVLTNDFFTARKLDAQNNVIYEAKTAVLATCGADVGHMLNGLNGINVVGTNKMTFASWPSNQSFCSTDATSDYRGVNCTSECAVDPVATTNQVFVASSNKESKASAPTGKTLIQTFWSDTGYDGFPAVGRCTNPTDCVVQVSGTSSWWESWTCVAHGAQRYFSAGLFTCNNNNFVKN